MAHLTSPVYLLERKNKGAGSRACRVAAGAALRLPGVHHGMAEALHVQGRHAGDVRGDQVAQVDPGRPQGHLDRPEPIGRYERFGSRTLRVPGLLAVARSDYIEARGSWPYWEQRTLLRAATVPATPRSSFNEWRPG